MYFCDAVLRLDPSVLRPGATAPPPSDSLSLVTVRH